MRPAADPIESILGAAVEIESEAERRAYLERACGGDADLRRRVDRLIANHFRAGSFLESPARWSTADLPIREGPGTAVGPYKLLEPIGEGGFGVVFLAEQARPVRRRVALKVLKPGMDTAQVVARFEAERQALALMDHPNIARVYDAGSTDTGRPYFVMELVRGVPVTEFCDQNQSSVRERLGLFVSVCRAVQHAHTKGIIHRDLKPSNILVALHDGVPVAKVIDFGVAKAMGPRLTDRTLFTSFAQMVGTPLYMSPEQAELSGLDVDTRADIYALGVLLYELLTGTTPFDKDRLKSAGYDEIRRIIREEEPAKPSTRISTLGLAAATVSANRASEARKLSALVRGELDWIVMKALEKDRNRRYDTASAFAQDVQRYLADEPVLACPPSVGYRLGKFLKRNKGPVLAASLVGLAALGGGIGVAYGLTEGWRKREVTSLWHQAEVARGEAEAARDGQAKAKRDAEDAREKLAAVEYGRAMQIAHQEWWDGNVAATLALLEGTRPDLRGWEWHYVYRLCHSELLAFRGHTEPVSSPSFSPDGSKVLTASHDHTARVWDARTGAEVLTLRHPDAVVAAAFNRDGSRLVTGCIDHAARVWDAKTGAEVLTLEHPDAVIAAAFSPDGSRVATACHDRITRVWDATTRKELLAFKHTHPVMSVAFSPDGSRLVTGCGDQTATVWDAKTGGELLVLRGHTASVRAAAFSPDGERLVTGSLDRTARVWDLKTGAAVLTLRHADAVLSAAFSPDGSQFATATHDRTARVWDAKTGIEILTLRGHTGSVRAVSFSPDGSRLVTSSMDRTARVWDLKARAEARALQGHGGQVWPASYSRDGSRLVTAGVDRTARVWDAATGAVVLTLQHPQAVYGASFSPDGSRVATAGNDHLARIWDAKTGGELLVLRGHTGSVRAAAFSPDGRRVVTASHDRTARVWDLTTGAAVLVLKHTDTVQSACFSPDGSRVVTTGSDKAARVWDADTGAEVLALRGHLHPVLGVAFSADGSRLVTGSLDRTVRVWDAHSGAELLVLKGHGGAIWSVAFSPDGSRVVSTGSVDRTARVWDARTGVPVLTLKHTDTVQSAAFSPDGSRLVTSGGATVWIWDGRPPPKVEFWAPAPLGDGP